MNGLIQLALRRSVIVGLVVGTILNIINQGDAMMGQGTFSLAKLLLTYLVPYCVATYGAVSALRDVAAQKPRQTES